MVSLYKIIDTPGKGQGLSAASNITKGTRILAESPLFEVPRSTASKERVLAGAIEKITALTVDERKAFYALHNTWPEAGKELGIIKTNALPLGSNANKGAIFLIASRINHSCKSNSQNTWNENIQQITIHATEDIDMGSEITIPYLDTHADHTTRRYLLKSHFKFECACNLCGLSTVDRKTSDSHLNEIQRLDELIGNGQVMFSVPLKALQNVQRLLQLFRSEGIQNASVPRAYYDAFQIAITHGDQARAKIFAERARSNRILVEGHDSPTVEKLQRWIDCPTQHNSYGYSEKWKSTTKDVPENLNDELFENWLWRKTPSQSIQTQLASLDDKSTFPLFENLPSDNDVDTLFFETRDSFSYHPRKHWAFLGEIVEIEYLFRLRLLVKDQGGQVIPIAFYTDKEGDEIPRSMLKIGNTVMILYPESHGFLDMTYGIRHESQKTLKVNRSATCCQALNNDHKFDRCSLLHCRLFCASVIRYKHIPH